MRTRQERYDLIKSCSSDPNVYALLQPDIEYFDSAEGFLGYRRSFLRPVVLGDPVCPKEKLPTFIKKFHDEWPNAIYAYISQDFAQTLHEVSLGYRFCPFSSERILHLDNRQWLERKKIKGAAKKAKKAKLAMHDVDFETVPQNISQMLTEVNQEFVERTPAKAEVTFISRAVELRNQEGVRTMSLSCVEKGEHRDFGFLVLDPYFSQGEHIGYQLNAIRFRRTRIWGVYYSIVCQLAEMLREEGFSRLSLGGCAFDLIEEASPFPHDEKMEGRLAWIRERADDYYVLSHFTEMKQELGGFPLRRYFAISSSASVTRTIVRFLRVSAMI